MKHREINLSNGSQDYCSVVDCNNSIKRSVSRKKVDLIPELELNLNGKKVGLCQSCYRIFKKVTKKDRTLESLGRWILLTQYSKQNFEHRSGVPFNL